jgi:P pilus assembly chaperone PapD
LAYFAQSKILRTLSISSLVLATVVLNPMASKAQVSLAPLIIEAEATQGQAQGFITVSNESDKPFRARVYAEPFTYNRDDGFQSLKSDATDLTPYLQFSPRELVVQPGMNRRIRLITRFPPSLPMGEYRAVIFTENLSESEDATGNKVSIAARIGATFYVRQGKLTPSLNVESASWNEKQQNIQVLVKNTGQASARPSINWTLKKGATVIKTGEVQATGIVAQGDRNLSLTYPTQADPALPSGEYQLTGELVWGKSMWGANIKEFKQVPFSFSLIVPAMKASVTQSHPKSLSLIK